jgi:Holliday junction resolvasome RuvABC endonuclease subunit
MTASSSTLTHKQGVGGPEVSGARPTTPLNAEVEPIPRGSLGTPAGPRPRPAGRSAAPAPSGAAEPTTSIERTVPRVYGLDLSLTATGIAYADSSTSTIKTKLTDRDLRLGHIRDQVAAALGGPVLTADITSPWPDLVVIEDLPTHAKSAGITGMVHGVVRELLSTAGVPYTLVSPATLKKFATGKGNADKTAMAIAALKRAGLEFPDDNQVDAFWLHAMGRDHLGFPLFAVPAAQRDAMGKVAWPEVSL